MTDQTEHPDQPDQPELLLREVFVEDAETVVPRLNLAELARKRVGRRRRTQRVVAIAATVVTVAAAVAVVSILREPVASRLPVPVPAAVTPIEVASIDQLVPIVKRAHLLRPVTIDSGAVRLTPTTGNPRLAELRAVQMWAAAAPSGSLVTTDDPVVFLADVTLAVALQPSGSDAPSPKVAPRFSHRQAWVFVWGTNSAHYYCPYSSAPPTVTAVPGVVHPVGQVQLIAADSSGEGVIYSLASAPCGTLAPAHAEIATYFRSLPWAYSISSSGQAIATVTVPDCSVVSGSGGSGSTTALTVYVSVEVAMVRPPCSGGSTATLPLDLGRSTGPPGHGATGLLVGRYDTLVGGVSALTYYDGHTRTLS